jgi:BirA family transcriptional regulator, biotin operon repressor / biotin---[acetyl-CoA-carboxylase] ligase
LSEPSLKTTLYIPITVLNQTESSNNHALEAVKTGFCTQPNAWFAIEQTSGKGQRGRVWMSQPGKNMILSIALPIAFLPLHQLFLLSAATALAGRQLIYQSVASNNCFIKWPNDLYHEHYKLGGILIETALHPSKQRWAVIGIGLNVNQTKFDANLPNASSLAMITGNQYNPLELSKLFCNLFIEQFNLLKTGQFSTILANYNAFLYQKEQKMRFKREGIVFTAVPEKVTEYGHLLVKECAYSEFKFGEIEWLGVAST